MTTAGEWLWLRMLVTVKAYPRPSKRYGETECVAGITEQGKWVRLYPVRYRDLEDRFKKWDWIEVKVKKSRNDHRTESFLPDHDSIKVIRHVDTRRQWGSRRNWVVPLLDPSLEELRETDRSLGFIKVRSLEDFVIESEPSDWTKEQESYLAQSGFFDKSKGRLEKVPYKFSYVFHCDGKGCPGHKLQFVDWEVFQAWRKWLCRYGRSGVLEKLRRKFQHFMGQQDLYFFVGTTFQQHRYKNWIIIGLFYPPLVASSSLTQATLFPHHTP